MKQEEKLHLHAGPRFLLVMLGLTALLLWGLLLNVNMGSVKIPAGDIFEMLLKTAGYGIGNLFTGGKFREPLRALMDATTESQIIFSIRLPRLLLAAVLGGGLSVSGFLLQTFFRNPIAGPPPSWRRWRCPAQRGLQWDF